MDYWYWAVHTLLAIALTIVVGYTYSWNHYRKYKFPPSPPGRLPFIGHAHLMPSKFPGDKTKEWADQLGSEMMYLRFAGVDWVFLNSSRVVEELLEKRSAIYSGRPNFTMVGELMSKNRNLGWLGYNRKWRDLRRVHHQLLTGASAEQYKPMQERESRQAMLNLLMNPDKWYLETIRVTASFIQEMVYGIREGVTQRFTNVSAVLDELLRNNAPGMWLVDGYPQLRYLPKFLQWWRPFAEKAYQQARDSFMEYYNLMETNIAAGTQKDCFALKFYAEADADNSMFDFDQRLFTIGGILQAGSDTTRHQMNMIFVAMACDPGEWISKARKELDEVCGNAGRLPSFDDWHRLPYIHAIVKESMRWRSNVNQTGFPHALTQDDEFEGYKLPAGTVVTINNWAIALDPREYEDPTKFKPERFLNEDLYNPLKGQYGFGVGTNIPKRNLLNTGRRACVGYKVANNSLFSFFSKLIYCFDVKPDPNQPIDTFHIAQSPPSGRRNDEPFKVFVSVRSEAHRQLILRECAGTEKAEY